MTLTPPEHSQDLENLSTVEYFSLLHWYDTMGVNAFLDEEALDYTQLTQEIKQAQQQSNSAQTPQTRVNNAQPFPFSLEENREDSAQNTQKIARDCSSLNDLQKALEEFEGCSLKNMAQNLVFADGNPDSEIMFIGEAPGRDEDIQGKPFAGRTGQLLDKMIASIGLNRETSYITNIVYWRPPGNRTPTPEESAACRPFLERQIELVQPKIIVLLGGAVTKELLDPNAGILKMRGKWKTLTIGELSIPTIATLHPTYLLRQPAQKKLVWQDLRLIHKKISE